ncbi:MAG: hypothetical protein RL538_436 [Candidatus Parcubacteria bacterium]|jgi:hypothetical protein
MVSVGSLPVNGNAVFDFDSQSGVMHLLASIRQSEIPAPQKSELRDLVFLYSNGGKDQTVRLSLEQKITAYGVTPAPVKKPVVQAPPAPPLTIGKYRVAPSFAAPAAPQATSVPAPKTTTIPVFTAAPAWIPTEEVKSEPAREEIVPTPVPVEPVVVAPIPQPQMAATQQPIAPAPQAPAAAPEAPVISADANEYLARIREIKASVNEKVGNPVNLVDINNEVGREYMGALLDAMKRLNSGSSAGSAMKRLEDAYAAVLKTLEARESAESVAPHAEVAEPAPSVSIPIVREPEPQPDFAPVESREEAVEETSRFEAPIEPEPAMPQPAFVPLGGMSTQEPAPAPKPVFSAPAPPVQNVPSVEPLGRPATPPPQPQAFVPLSDLKKPHTLEDLQNAASLKAAAEAAGDPLFSKEVDDGLDQLLGEWSIFKKSGLFGTGPKGKEHPLFKKIAPLHIPLLLAGRFEGATQEIKQSITDYMNGWRYEQGIIYQQGETFEHYLRRVIRHIIDLQKGK